MSRLRTITLAILKYVGIVLLSVLIALAGYIGYGLVYEYMHADETKALSLSQIRQMEQDSIDKGDSLGARIASDKCLELDENDADCWILLGKAFYIEDDCAAATAAIYRASQLPLTSEQESFVSTILDASKACVNSAGTSVLEDITKAQGLMDSLQCPSEYTTSEEIGNALGDFAGAFSLLHPDAGAEDWIAGRIDFYISHSCLDELKKYGYAGGEITQEVLAKLVKNMIAFVDKNSQE